MNTKSCAESIENIKGHISKGFQYHRKTKSTKVYPTRLIDLCRSALEMGLRHREIAVLAGVSSSTIYKWDKGTRRPQKKAMTNTGSFKVMEVEKPAAKQSEPALVISIAGVKVEIFGEASP